MTGTLMPIFPSGKVGLPEYRDGKWTAGHKTSGLSIELILRALYNSRYWPLRCITQRRRLAMIRHLFFTHYELAYKAFAALVTIGAAAFLAYLVMQVRW
jgi:hypothetical protein